MGSAQSAPVPTSDEIEAVNDRTEMARMIKNVQLSPSENLFDSCWNGDVKALKRDLLNGAEVDWGHRNLGGRTALHAAAITGHLKCCEILIIAGATVNVQDVDGRTPKDFAELAGLEEVADMLSRWTAQMPPSRGGILQMGASDQYTKKLKERGPGYIKDRPSKAPSNRTHGSKLIL
jgi:hypothetical protein